MDLPSTNTSVRSSALLKKWKQKIPDTKAPEAKTEEIGTYMFV